MANKILPEYAGRFLARFNRTPKSTPLATPPDSLSEIIGAISSLQPYRDLSFQMCGTVPCTSLSLKYLIYLWT